MLVLFGKQKNKHIQILNKIQNKAFYLIYATFHTTSIYVLELEAFIPLLGIYFNFFTKHTTIYFNKLSINNFIL